MTTNQKNYGPTWNRPATISGCDLSSAPHAGPLFSAPTGTAADTNRLLAQQESHSERQWEQVAEVTGNPPAHAPRQPSGALKNRHGFGHAGTLTAQNGAA
jgi:hypothetical protein